MGIGLLELENDRMSHPVDLIEYVGNMRDWNFERTGDDEIAVAVAGHWTNYHISYAWMEDFESLHFSCAFDVKVQKNRINELIRLLALINEQMLMGHFDFWEQEGAIMFRQSLLLAGGAEATEEQVEVLLNSAVEVCETYYHAIQAVMWSGVKARAALQQAMFETIGEA